jgi:DNA-binding transcriptional MerR regulator
MDATATGRTWRVGELAEQTGLTVRALHHYDEIGLLVPSARTGAGHRLYTADDLRRLHRILALRGFGLSLAGIGELLAGTGPDPKVLLRQQLAQVDERIAVSHRLRDRLLRVLAALDHKVEPSGEELVELIEVMTTMEQRLTPQQVERMQAERVRMAEQLTPEERAELERRRAEFTAGLTKEELAEMARRRAALMPDRPAG